MIQTLYIAAVLMPDNVDLVLTYVSLALILGFALACALVAWRR